MEDLYGKVEFCVKNPAPIEETLRRYSDEAMRMQRVKGIGLLFQGLLPVVVPFGEKHINAFVKMGKKLFWTSFISHDIFSLSFINIFLGFVLVAHSTTSQNAMKTNYLGML